MYWNILFVSWLWRWIKGKMKKKKKKSVGECKIELRGLETVGAVPECESGVLTVTGALRLHDTWHVSSPNASRSPPPRHHRPPATDAAATHRNRNDNVRQRKGIIQNQGPGHGLCARRGWESSRFASDLSVSLMQRRPQIHYKPIICARAGAGAGHSLVNCSA